MEPARAAEPDAWGSRTRHITAASTTPGCSITLARCRAVGIVPHDEDYGFVTVEAFAASRR
jgi:hypothetical protein